ncbi:MAG: M55 family metallopeptidase [Opitutaceae bacterium]
MKKIFVGTDMEGCAGVVSFQDQSYPTGRYYDQGKRIVTAEINAAVDGMLETGVEDILVWDGHGAGAIWFEDLHSAAKLLHGRPSPTRAVLDSVVSDYEACVMLGQHAMAGIQMSNQNHTQSSQTIDYYKLNGQLIGEIAQFALYMGDLGLPLIFLCGEEAACREAEALVPGIVTASVKKGLGRGSAISVSAREAHRRIREGIRKAVENHRDHPIAPLVWDGPFVLEKRFFHTDNADAAAGQAGAERVDGQTVRFRSDRIRDIIYR